MMILKKKNAIIRDFRFSNYFVLKHSHYTELRCSMNECIVQEKCFVLYGFLIVPTHKYTYADSFISSFQNLVMF